MNNKNGELNEILGDLQPPSPQYKLFYYTLCCCCCCCSDDYVVKKHHEELSLTSVTELVRFRNVIITSGKLLLLLIIRTLHHRLSLNLKTSDYYSN